MAGAADVAAIVQHIDKVHPCRDHIVVMHKGAASSAPTHKRLNTDMGVPTIADIVARLSDGAQDTWIAPASFTPKASGSRRDRRDVRFQKAIWWDTDIRDLPKHYTSETEALDGIANWQKASEYPPPNYTVHSGGGFHFYYVFARLLELDEWQDLANALQHSLLAGGVCFDQAITVDATRVLRPAGTFNYKIPGVSRRVRALFNGPEIDPDTLPKLKTKVSGTRVKSSPALVTTTVALANPPAHVQAYLQTAPATTSQALQAGVQPTKTFELADFGIVVRECQILRGVVTTGGATCDEPQWRESLQELCFAKDPENWLHKLSEGHPGYNAAATEAKFAAIKSQLERNPNIGPVTCQRLCTTFTTPIDPDPCAGCRYRGRIGAPTTIPFYMATLPAGGWRNDLTAPALLWRPGAEDEYTFITPWALRDLQLIEDNASLVSRSALLGTAVVKGGLELPFEVDLAQVADVRGLNNILALQRLTPPNVAQASRLLWGLQAMRDNLRADKRVTADVTSMGWGTDIDGTLLFTHGYNTFDASGLRSARTRIARYENIQTVYAPRGSLLEWQQLVAPILADPRPEVHVALAAAFAGPLVKFVGQHGLLLAFVSPESGTGKTTWLKVAQSVWGLPSRIHAVDDTTASIARYMGVLGSITNFHDEVRGSKEQKLELYKFLMRVGQGVEKSRLNSGGALQEKVNWNTVQVYANNISMQLEAEQLGAAEAGVARILEFPIGLIQGGGQISDMLLASLENQCGTAGSVYAQQLLRRIDFVRTQLDHTQQTVNSLFPGGPTARLLKATSTVLITGAMLAKTMGIIPLDPVLVIHACHAATCRAVSHIDATRKRGSGIELVRDYLASVNSQIIFLDRSQKHAATGTYVIAEAPANDRMPVMVEVSVSANMAWVMLQMTEWRSWLRRLGFDPGVKTNELIAQYGAMLHTGQIAASTKFASPTRELLLIPRTHTGL